MTLNEELEKKIQALKERVEQLSLFDPEFSLVMELGKITVCWDTILVIFGHQFHILILPVSINYPS